MCIFIRNEAFQVAVVVKNLPANVGDIRDACSTPGFGRFPGGGHGNPLQYSDLENPMDKGAWRATIHRVTKSWTQLKQLSTHSSKHTIRTGADDCYFVTEIGLVTEVGLANSLNKLEKEKN